MLFPLALLLLLSACGGGGGAATNATTPTSKSVAVKLASSGTLTGKLSGLQVTVTLPVGVTAATDAGGAVLSSVVVPSGVTANNATIPATLTTYTAPTGTANGSLTFVLVSTLPAGFATGEFATATLAVAANSTPTASAFFVTDFKPVDLFGNAVSGLTATASVP